MHIHPELAPHQVKAVGELSDGKILVGGVGSGKSRVGLAYYALTEGHEDLYVITTAKKRDNLDWEKEAVKFGIGKEKDATLYGTMTIDSWNNIAKYVDVKNGFFIFDEQRVVGKGKWAKSFMKIALHNRWIMLSATPGDTWLDYVPVFVANGFYRNRTEFMREHVIPKPYINYFAVERYVNTGRLVRHRNSILVTMPYAKQTTRHQKTVWCEYDEEKMVRVAHGRWNVYKDEPIRDIAEMFSVMRRVVNSDPSRAQAVRQLIEKFPRLILFYNFNYELDIIRELCEPLWSTQEVAFAEWNGHKHEEIPETAKWVYAVQYVAGSEGWNCVSTNATCFYSLPYSYKMWEQAHGRTDRMNTQYLDLYYFDLRSKSDIDRAIWRSLKAKKAFQIDHFDMNNAEFADFSVK